MAIHFQQAFLEEIILYLFCLFFKIKSRFTLSIKNPFSNNYYFKKKKKKKKTLKKEKKKKITLPSFPLPTLVFFFDEKRINLDLLNKTKKYNKTILTKEESNSHPCSLSPPKNSTSQTSKIL